MSQSIPGNEMVPYEASPDESLSPQPQSGFNPMRALYRRIAKRGELQEQQVEILTVEVAKKLLQGIAEKGMVSVFHDKDTGQLTTEMYSAYFSSAAPPSLHVYAVRENVPKRSDMGGNQPQLWIQVMEHMRNGGADRVVNISHDWKMPQGTYKTRFKGGSYNERALTPKEKIKFLEDILATKVDEEQTEKKFGAPYTPGGTRSSTRMGDTQEHTAYWVRDMHGKLAPLSERQPSEIDPNEHLAINA